MTSACVLFHRFGHVEYWIHIYFDFFNCACLLQMSWTCNSMNNLSLYCGLVDARKDLPVCTNIIIIISERMANDIWFEHTPQWMDAMTISQFLDAIEGKEYPEYIGHFLLTFFSLQSNLVIRIFLVTLKLFLNAKCSLSLWSKLQIVPYHQVWL